MDANEKANLDFVKNEKSIVGFSTQMDPINSRITNEMGCITLDTNALARATALLTGTEPAPPSKPKSLCIQTGNSTFRSGMK